MLLSLDEVDELECYVGRGAKWMDDIEPDWFNIISIHRLNMSDSDRCICGQIFMENVLNCSGYSYALNNLFGSSDNFSSHYGFSYQAFGGEDEEYLPDYARTNEGYEYLAIFWIEQIQKRRANAGTML